MKRLLIILCTLVLFSANSLAWDVYGPSVGVREVDGDPNIDVVTKLIVPNNTLTKDSTEGTLDFGAAIDQDVSSGSSPTFDGTNFTGIPATALPNADDDGTTKGVATFDNTDFNATSGLVTIEDSGIDHGNLTGLSTGADHSYIDQSVVSGSSPTFGGANITTELSNDTTPQLGGNLDGQSNNLNNIGTIDLDGGQIAFPATAVPSGDANTLDDYEEGTWTPDVRFGGSSTGITYTEQVGFYTRVGNIVQISAKILLSSKGSANGNATIMGLPFPVANNNAARSGITIGYNNAVSFADQIFMFTHPNSGTIVITEATNAGASGPITDGDFVNTSQLFLGGTYRGS